MHWLRLSKCLWHGFNNSWIYSRRVNRFAILLTFCTFKFSIKSWEIGHPDMHTNVSLRLLAFQSHPPLPRTPCASLSHPFTAPQTPIFRGITDPSDAHTRTIGTSDDPQSFPHRTDPDGPLGQWFSQRLCLPPGARPGTHLSFSVGTVFRPQHLMPAQASANNPVATGNCHPPRVPPRPASQVAEVPQRGTLTASWRNRPSTANL